MSNLISQEEIASIIYFIRGKKIMLDKDLAKLYEVSTSLLNQSVKRNKDRFPKDFMFQLTKKEAKFLRSQFVILKQGEHIKYLPYAFTEQGVAMLSGVLHSTKAVVVNVAIMRAFVKLRKTLSAHKELAYKLNQLEHKIEKHDEEIQSIFKAIHELMLPPERLQRKIGF